MRYHVSPVYSCRECEQPINQATEVCPYCGADLTQSPPASDDAPPPRKKSPARVAILLFIVLLTLAAIAWFAFPWRLAGSKSEFESHAQAALAALQQSLAGYQSTEGTFPSSLESLGTQARAAFDQAQAGRYTLQYTPGDPQPDGAIKTYSLTARAGNYGYLNFFIDETGIIRATRENRPATASDPPVAPAPSKSP
ncbi:MAG TPA: hypothetical protein VMH00_17530 [Candidatus Limnocylindrales bacterium]|nr:hypothetical protein [Candidatus Limnocylindrales bacterium]